MTFSGSYTRPAFSFSNSRIATGEVISLPRIRSRSARINSPALTESLPQCAARIYCVMVMPIKSPAFLYIRRSQKQLIDRADKRIDLGSDNIRINADAPIAFGFADKFYIGNRIGCGADLHCVFRIRLYRVVQPDA